MKKIYFLFSILFFKNIISQEVLFDKWQTVTSYSATTLNNMQDYKTTVTVGEKILLVVDTLPLGMYNQSGIFSYDINTRILNPLPFSLAPGDRGITCATAYKSTTPGLSYGLFGCMSSPDAGASYPVIYTYNSSTNLITADSLTIGTWQDNDGGMKHIAMFSPLTNNDTIRVFSSFNLTTHVFKKHINQTGFIPTSTQVPIESINCSFTYNNKLYIGGMYNSEAALLESSDGTNFTPVTGFIPSNFSSYSFVNNIDTLNGELYYTVSIDQTGFEIFKYNTTTHTSVHQQFGIDRIKDLKTHKNKLWYSTFRNESMNVSSSIFYISNGTSIQSAEQIGYQEIDGNKLSFASTNDSLYFVGNYGTFFAAKSTNTHPNLQPNNIMDVYLKVWKLMPPTSSFNYNNNQICLNATESFTSTSQNTDSLHWLIDNIYYASSPGPSAFMNINFPTTGNHSVGLVAFGGTLTDTSFLAVNVYDINISIAATRTLVCYTSTVSGTSVLTSTVTGGIGAVTYDWNQIYPPTVSVGSGSSYTFTPTSWGTPYGFFLIATDIHGCSAASNTISISSNPLRDIEFYALSGSSPTFTPALGNVVLYKYESTLGKFDSIAYLPTNSIGYNFFPTVDDGDYILKAIPSASSLQVSYYGNNATMWKDATPFTHTCVSPRLDTINVIPLSNIGLGPGVLTGSVYQGNGFGNRMANEGLKPMVPGTPIGGIIVKGGKNPGGQMFVQTVTAADGTYTLSGIPINTGDEYFVLVDIPGLDTSSTYHRILVTGNSYMSGLDFIVDSVKIYPVGNITTVTSQDNSVFENKITLFPNPTKDISFIEYELLESSNMQIEIVDILGKKAKTILEESKQEKNKYKHQINLSDLNSGIYFVKIKINTSENVIKMIITN